MRPEEEWPLWVTYFDNLCNFCMKLLGVFCLLAEVLSLQYTVERRNNFAIDLLQVSLNLVEISLEPT